MPNGIQPAIDDSMAKDLEKMTPSERMAAVSGEMHLPGVVAKAERLVELAQKELRAAQKLRDAIADYHGVPISVSEPYINPAISEIKPSNIARSSDLFEWDVAALGRRYLSDERSPYRRLRHATRRSYEGLIRRIIEDFGSKKPSDLKEPDILSMYESWTGGGSRVSMAHACMTMFRALIHFGADYLEDEGCGRLSVILHKMRFAPVQARRSYLTQDQAIAVIKKAHERNFHSIALAQAIQFDCKLSQKDVVGEWVPITEIEPSDVIDGDKKWLRGVRWNNIDSNLILQHVSSRTLKRLKFDLRKAPLVREEFDRISNLPRTGPIIINEATKKPYLTNLFRLTWRELATAAGVPKDVRNADSRVGGEDDEDDGGEPASDARRSILME